MGGDHEAGEGFPCRQLCKLKECNLIKMFHLKASPQPAEEAASVLYHTKHIGALIKDVSSLASFSRRGHEHHARQFTG